MQQGSEAKQEVNPNNLNSENGACESATPTTVN